jgi:hypothetical protein
LTTNFHVVQISHNKKTGPIPVASSDRFSCPDACPLKNNGCYAESGPLRLWWNRLTEGRFRTKEALELIERLPYNQLWRYAVAGDLPGDGDKINEYQLKKLVKANGPRQGFTYTHKPVLAKAGQRPAKYVLKNRELIAYANEHGFRVNLTANNLTMADELVDLDIAPVVSIAPKLSDPWWDQWGEPKRIETPKGRPCIVCPESTGARVQCSTCRICQLPPANFTNYRDDIVLFPAHGSGRNKVTAIFKGETRE